MKCLTFLWSVALIINWNPVLSMLMCFPQFSRLNRYLGWSMCFLFGSVCGDQGKKLNPFTSMCTWVSRLLPWNILTCEFLSSFDCRDNCLSILTIVTNLELLKFLTILFPISGWSFQDQQVLTTKKVSAALKCLEKWLSVCGDFANLYAEHSYQLNICCWRKEESCMSSSISSWHSQTFCKLSFMLLLLLVSWVVARLCTQIVDYGWMKITLFS